MTFHRPFRPVDPARRRYRGWTFDSKAEMGRAELLDVELAAGEIRWWLRQVPVDLTDDDRYRLDFLVCNADGVIHGEDVKSVLTREFKRTMRLWAKYGPFPLHVVKPTRKGYVTAEVITRA